MHSSKRMTFLQQFKTNTINQKQNTRYTDVYRILHKYEYTCTCSMCHKNKLQHFYVVINKSDTQLTCNKYLTVMKYMDIE